MDIVKQITVLLWLLGAVLITPPILRYFDIDPKTAIRKVLMVEGNPRRPLMLPKQSSPPKKKKLTRVFLMSCLKNTFRKLPKSKNRRKRN